MRIAITLRRLLHSTRAVAAVEFALIAPLLLLLMGSAVDYGLAFYSKGVLAGSVAQGAQYAMFAGTQVSAASIKSIVQKSLSLPAANVTVSGPACYCLSGSPAVASSQTCSTPCADSTQPATYVRISATYTFQSVMPLLSQLSNPTISETATARLN